MSECRWNIYCNQEAQRGSEFCYLHAKVAAGHLDRIYYASGSMSTHGFGGPSQEARRIIERLAEEDTSAKEA